MTYYHIFKKRGYKPFLINRKMCIYVKNHKCNLGIITVLKDPHCKGIDFTYEVKNMVKDNGFNLANLDLGYMQKELEYIKSKVEGLHA